MMGPSSTTSARRRRGGSGRPHGGSGGGEWPTHRTQPPPAWRARDRATSLARWGDPHHHHRGTPPRLVDAEDEQRHVGARDRVERRLDPGRVGAVHVDAALGARPTRRRSRRRRSRRRTRRRCRARGVARGERLGDRREAVGRTARLRGGEGVVRGAHDGPLLVGARPDPHRRASRDVAKNRIGASPSFAASGKERVVAPAYLWVARERRVVAPESARAREAHARTHTTRPRRVTACATPARGGRATETTTEPAARRPHVCMSRSSPA